MRLIKISLPLSISTILIVSILSWVGASSPVWAATKGKDTAKPIQTQTAKIIFVDADAQGAETGNLWEDAYIYLQDALAAASYGDIILVAEGVYYPDEGLGQINDAVTSTFKLVDGVSLYGGFNPDIPGWPDWEKNITVLSGDIDHETNPDITDDAGVVLTTTDIIGINAYRVMFSTEVSTTTVLDGFFITAGVNTLKSYAGFGGGMYNYSHSSPTLTNLVFSGNYAFAGGGLTTHISSNPNLTNVTFTHNYGEIVGGGMLNQESSPTLQNVLFYANSADVWGGGIYTWEGSPTLKDVEFRENISGLDGGGMAIGMHENDMTLTNVNFIRNSAFIRGGGVISSGARIKYYNVLFYNNSASIGGGMSIENHSDADFTNVIFLENQASDYGGGLRIIQSNPSLKNVKFLGNTAQNFGGGISIYSGNSDLTNVIFAGNAANAGAGMWQDYQCDSSLTNVTFANNAAITNGILLNMRSSTFTLTNTILWGNTPISDPQVVNDADSAAIFKHSLIQGSGGSGPGWNSYLGIDGGGNLDSDPLFLRDPNPGDGDWTTQEDNDYGDLHLRSPSPAIDTGTNNGCPFTDLDNRPRPTGAFCDMGAYEHWYLVYSPLVLK